MRYKTFDKVNSAVYSIWHFCGETYKNNILDCFIIHLSTKLW